jgi:MATE family multidrug resistance protein
MSTADTLRPPMSAAGHVRATLALGLPLIGSHLAQVALHVTDTIMVGWYGVVELAAVVLGSTSFFIVFVVGAGFANAVMPLVAAAAAQGDAQRVRRATRMGMWLSIAYGLALYPVFFFAEPIFRALGQAEDVSHLAGDYLAIAGTGMLPALLIMALKSHLAGLSRTQVVLWVTVAGVFLNAGLNWMLIFGRWGAPEMGVEGAAVASVVTQAATLLALAIYAGVGPVLRDYRLWQRFWRPDPEVMARVFRLGWPIGLTSLAEGGLFQATAIMMGWIGTVQLAAHGIALEVTSVTFMVHLGLSNAATVRAGHAFGARDIGALKDGARVAIVLSLVFALMTVAIFLAVPRPIIALFTDLSKPEAEHILAFGALLLAYAALFQVADGVQVMGLGLLRGVQDTRVPMAIAIFGYWAIGMPAAYGLAFPAGLGGPGLWLGLCVGLTVTGSLLMWRFWARAGRIRAA